MGQMLHKLNSKVRSKYLTEFRRGERLSMKAKKKKTIYKISITMTTCKFKTLYRNKYAMHTNYIHDIYIYDICIVMNNLQQH